MALRGRISLLAATAIVVAACGGGGATPVPSGGPTDGGSTPIPGGLLEKVLTAGKVVVSTDPNYAPQSIQNPDGSYEGFDIDVANEIAKRMGVTVEYLTPSWDTITAGGWSGRWDMSVGSMTITSDRQQVLAFSDPYYYTPAQMTVSEASGITTLEELEGRKICVGKSTTYLDWLEGRPLDFGTLSPTTTPPSGAQAVTLGTDQECPQQWAAGRNDFEGWLSSGTAVQAAIDAAQPVVPVGEPVYAEPLAVATDLNGPDPSDFIAKVTEIVQEMHADGTLTGFSEKWFDIDLTKAPTP